MAQGATVADMMARFGVVAACIRADLRARGLASRDGGTKFVARNSSVSMIEARTNRLARLGMLVGRGMTTTALAAELGCGSAQVNRDLKALGLDNSTLPAPIQRKILKLRKGGASFVQIAQDLGVSLKCVIDLVKVAG